MELPPEKPHLHILSVLSPGGRDHPLHLISCSDQQASDLLKVEFIKVSTNTDLFIGPVGHLGSNSCHMTSDI